MSKTNYTFTFDRGDERRFDSILGRLDPEEYNIVESKSLVDTKNPRESDLQTVIEMDEESALTFRMGMTHLKIRRQRTEEELAEEAALKEKNTVRITVQVPPEDA